MQESCGEGSAAHTGPESCADARKGIDEALTGVRAGRVLSRENQANFGMPTQYGYAEGNTGDGDKASRCNDPARSETPSMPGNSACGNREIPRPTSRDGT